MILERFKVPAKDQVLVSEAALRRTVTEIFEKLGVSKEDAAEAADVLTMTDLRGVETHGVSNMLRAYVRDYKAGKLNPQPGWRIEREAPATAVIDAEKRLGIIVGPKAMRLAIDKARAGRRAGWSPCTTAGTSAPSAISPCRRAMQDMVGVCFTAAGLHVVPTFAARPLLGTNPIALAAPARHEAPMLFDAATSAIAGNKIRLAMRVGSPLLPGLGHRQGRHPDHGGEARLRSRRLLPGAARRAPASRAPHKGYGFALMAEVLATALSGALPTMLAPASGSKNQFAAYNIAAFTDVGAVQGHHGRDAQDACARPRPPRDRSASSIRACPRPKSSSTAAPRGFPCTRRCSSGSASARARWAWRPDAHELSGRPRCPSICLTLGLSSRWWRSSTRRARTLDVLCGIYDVVRWDTVSIAT